MMFVDRLLWVKHLGEFDSIFMTPISPSEQHILNAIDHTALIETLSQLITFRSIGGDEIAIQRFVAEIMRELGLEVDRWEIDLGSLRENPAYTPEIERDLALGVVGQWGGANGPSLILNGHVDVVGAGDLDRWSFPPWELTQVGERYYGRGSVDMKGAFCCALYALKAVMDGGAELAGSVQIQSVIGEEDGGIGTLATIERGHTADAAIVLEPTELKIAPAQAGALNFRLIVPGLAAHGALRTEGIHPFDHYLPLYNAIRRFELERNLELQQPLFADYEIPFPISIGRLWAGDWPSTVPDSFVCEGRIGVGTSEKPNDVREAFESMIDKASQPDPWLQERPPIVEWWGAQFEPASISETHPLVQSLSDAHSAITSTSPKLQGMPYGADMRLLVNEAQIPTVLYGPGDIRRAHAPDEYITREELRTAVEVITLMILRYCS